MALRHLTFKVLPNMNNKVHCKNKKKYQTPTSECTDTFLLSYIFFEKKITTYYLQRISL